jgi:hypothetical protein
MNDGAQIEICGDVVGEVLGNDNEDMLMMETAWMRGASSDVTRRTSNVASNLAAQLVKIGREVDAEIGVEVCGDGGSGRLNLI